MKLPGFNFKKLKKRKETKKRK